MPCSPKLASLVEDRKLSTLRFDLCDDGDAVPVLTAATAEGAVGAGGEAIPSPVFWTIGSLLKRLGVACFPGCVLTSGVSEGCFSSWLCVSGVAGSDVVPATSSLLHQPSGREFVDRSVIADASGEIVLTSSGETLPLVFLDLIDERRGELTRKARNFLLDSFAPSVSAKSQVVLSPSE